MVSLKVLMSRLPKNWKLDMDQNVPQFWKITYETSRGSCLMVSSILVGGGYRLTID